MRKRTHPIAEHARRIDIRELRRVGAFDNGGGEFPWIGLSFPGLVSMRTDGRGADIEFDYFGLVGRQRLTIGWSRCGRYAPRLKFRCACGRHAELLFNPHKDRYACKRCWRLHYISQTMNASTKRKRRAADARHRLDGIRHTSRR